MPRFFFNNRHRDRRYLDPAGSDLPDLAAAMAEATRSTREMMADELRRGPLTPGRSFDIVGDDCLSCLPVSNALGASQKA
jgi:hypothetical protein